MAKIEHRALDHRRLREHQLDRLGLVELGLLSLVERAKGGARAIQHHLPTMLRAPAVEPLAVDALGLVVVKAIGDGLRVEPGTGLFHRVAGLDAI